MSISVETFGDVMVVNLGEELTYENVAQFEELLDAPVQQGRLHFVLNLEKTESLDSAGLKAIADLAELVRAGGGQIKVCGLGETCSKIFELTRFDARFEQLESVVEAVRSVR